MTDKENIHEVLSSLWKNDTSVGTLDYNQALQDAQTKFDLLLEEPVSDDLEEAVNAYIGYAPEVDESSSTYGKRQAFKAGANWQKQQMMKNAKDGVITFDYYGDNDKIYGCIAHDSFCLEELGLKDGDKVKLIIIKED